IDESEEALLFPSGMNAITMIFLAFLKAGDKVIYAKECYRNTKKLCSHILENLNIEGIPISLKDTDRFNDEFDNFYTEEVKIVFIESPSNPHLYLVDFEKIKQKLNQNTLLVVDSTFATPVNCKPKRFGADLVVHSCTKYIGGHADVLAGSIAGSSKLISRVRELRNVMGCVVDSHSAFLLNRSLATLKLRMEYLNRVGLAIANFLEGHERISKVFYTGLSSHPHYKLANKYLEGHGGVLTFEVNASKKDVSAFVDALEIPYMASNFGSHYSTIEQCSIFTYHALSKDEREDIGISDGLVRLSLGFEDIDEIVKDIEKNLEFIP
ncbi:MAG: aminotransferase class I/II-fold pyridoxal phosphate-dependent enzyme, partial [Cyanobacteriota bacterium]|nr:aminotransferase class I/II-fold pyridoxal phosphate-dependent enzyme [Cyanobacteriota bacterium]